MLQKLEAVQFGLQLAPLTKELEVRDLVLALSPLFALPFSKWCSFMCCWLASIVNRALVSFCPICSSSALLISESHPHSARVVVLSSHVQRLTSPQERMRAALRAWLPCSRALLRVCVDRLPSPVVAQQVNQSIRSSPARSLSSGRRVCCVSRNGMHLSVIWRAAACLLPRLRCRPLLTVRRVLLCACAPDSTAARLSTRVRRTAQLPPPFARATRAVP